MWRVWFSQALRGRLLRRINQLYKQKLDTKERNPRCFQNKHKHVLYSWYGGEPHIAQKQREQNTRERQMGTETRTIYNWNSNTHATQKQYTNNDYDQSQVGDTY